MRELLSEYHLIKEKRNKIKLDFQTSPKRVLAGSPKYNALLPIYTLQQVRE